jgi:hypothetical protein
MTRRLQMKGVLSQAKSYAKKGYKILQRPICRLGFKNVFCIGNHMLEYLNRLRNQDVVMPKPVGRVETNVSYILKFWMEDFFLTTVKNSQIKMCLIYLTVF